MRSLGRRPTVIRWSWARLPPMAPWSRCGRFPTTCCETSCPSGLATVPPGLVVVHPAVPATNLKEFAAWSRAQPQGVSYASSGVGGSGHLATELLRIKTDAKLVHVPYKDVGQGVADLLAGHVQMMIYYAPVLPHIRSGKLRGLAVLSEERVAFAKDLPTAIEQGVPGVVASGWAGLFAPAGLADPIRDKIYLAMKQALLEPEIKSNLADQGSEAVPLPPEEFRTLRQERDRQVGRGRARLRNEDGMSTLKAGWSHEL